MIGRRDDVSLLKKNTAPLISQDVPVLSVILSTAGKEMFISFPGL